MSRTAELQDKADDVKSQMQRNLNYAMERGERLEDMEKAADNLAIEAQTFEKTGKKLKRKEMFTNVKLWLAICVPFVCIVLIVLIIIAIVVAVMVSNQNNTEPMNCTQSQSHTHTRSTIFIS